MDPEFPTSTTTVPLPTVRRLESSTLSLALTLLLLVLPAMPDQATEPRRPAPVFAGATLGHGELASGDLLGKVVLLEFWASWCVSCIDGLPEVKALYAAHAGEGFEIVGISLDEEPRAARRAVAEHELPWPQICDGQGKQSPLALSYDVRGTPRFVLIDPQGRVAAEYVKPSQLEHKILELLAEN